jgi:hypothetical protein
MSNARVIKIGAERVYQLRPYESVRLTIEAEMPDTMLSDDFAIRATYLECVKRMDSSYTEIANNCNNPKK